MAADAPVQLVCMQPSLAIARVRRSALAAPASATSAWIVPLLQLLFATSSPLIAGEPRASRFFSLVETPQDVSIVLDQAMLDAFPADVLECEAQRWKALQVASAGAGAFVTQLAILTELTTRLARQHISVFQISTYQTDYILVKTEDLGRAICCLQHFCDIEMEEDATSMSDLAMEADDTAASLAAADLESLNADPSTSVSVVPSHPLSVPTMELSLVQIETAYVQQHMYALVRLLFGSYRGSTSRHGFLSYSEIGDEVSVVTSDAAFLQQMLALAREGGCGVVVSPDAWKLVQIGDKSLGFAETGIVARHTSVLLDAGTMVFYLSTYATDFMLIKLDEWDDALLLLRERFHLIEGRLVALMD